jgi:hypothetical protein
VPKTFIGTEFFPDQDEGQFTLNIKLPVGTRLEVTDQAVSEIEKIVQANVPEVQTMISIDSIAPLRIRLRRGAIHLSDNPGPGIDFRPPLKLLQIHRPVPLHDHPLFLKQRLLKLETAPFRERDLPL